MRYKLFIPIIVMAFLFSSVILSRSGTAQNEQIAIQSDDFVAASTPSLTTYNLPASPAGRQPTTISPSPYNPFTPRSLGEGGQPTTYNPQPTTPSPTSIPRIGEPAQEGNHVEVEVSADPQEYQGSCKNPLDITFTATISVEKPGSVQYQWIRSEEANPSSSQWVTFDQAGTKTISAGWRISSEKLVNLDFSGWQKMKILSPVEVESNQASFVVLCSL